MKLSWLLLYSLLNFCLAEDGSRIVSDDLSIEGEIQNLPSDKMERLKAKRRLLEKQNELLVKKQIESMRVRQESRLHQQMDESFTQVN